SGYRRSHLLGHLPHMPATARTPHHKIRSFMSNNGTPGPQHGPSTSGSGALVASDRNSLSVGSNGPLLLHDVHLVETLAHFNRERVPERNPHAKGSGAFGNFRTTEDVSAYTKAGLFQPDVQTEMLARF